MSFAYISSARHSRTESPDLFEQDSSALISEGDVSSLINIDQTIARSQKIIQESIELSKKNKERKNRLSERVKACMPSADKLNKPDIIPRASFDEVQIPTNRTDFTARSKRNESCERSPIKENLLNRLDDDSSVSESFHLKGPTGQDEIRLLKGQVSDLQVRLARQEDTNRSLKHELASQPERQLSGLKDVIDSQNREITRLRDELSNTQAEHNRVLQKLSDQNYYVQSVEEELDRFKTDGDHIKGSKEYRELHERYLELLKSDRSEDRHVQILQQEIESLRQANANLSRIVEAGRSFKSHQLVGKVEDLETKLTRLEAKYANQTFENGELKKKLLQLLEQTDSGRTEDVKAYTIAEPKPQAYYSDSSEDRLPPKPVYKPTETSHTPRVRSKKVLKKTKKRRNMSADRRRPCKFHCCGRRQCGSCLNK